VPACALGRTTPSYDVGSREGRRIRRSVKTLTSTNRSRATVTLTRMSPAVLRPQGSSTGPCPLAGRGRCLELGDLADVPCRSCRHARGCSLEREMGARGEGAAVVGAGALLADHGQPRSERRHQSYFERELPSPMVALPPTAPVDRSRRQTRAPACRTVSRGGRRGKPSRCRFTLHGYRRRRVSPEH